MTHQSGLPPEKDTGSHFDSEAARELAAKKFLEERQSYQTTLAELLRKIQYDSEVVGWYRLGGADAPTSREVLDAQGAYELSSPNFVLVVYDPWRSMAGGCVLRVLQLSKAYKALRRRGDFSPQCPEMQEMLKGEGVYREVSYSVHVPLLAQVFLRENAIQYESCDGNSVLAEREQTAYLKRSYTDLTGSIEELSRSLGDCLDLKWSRRKSRELTKEQEGEARHNCLLLSRQLQEDCDHLIEFSKEMARNSFAATALHE